MINPPKLKLKRGDAAVVESKESNTQVDVLRPEEAAIPGGL
jgi:hypothetical protein